MVAEAIFAVEPAGGGEFAEERTGGAGENRISRTMACDRESTRGRTEEGVPSF